MQIWSVTRLARINSIVRIVLNNLITTSYITMLGKTQISYWNKGIHPYRLAAILSPRGTKSFVFARPSQSPIPSWATNQQVLIIFFRAFRNKGEGAPAISDLVQRENNGTGYWIVNMSDSYWGREQYVIYCSQLRATPSADCNISHIALGLSNYLILIGWGWAWYHELSKPRSVLSAEVEGWGR